MAKSGPMLGVTCSSWHVEWKQKNLVWNHVWQRQNAFIKIDKQLVFYNLVILWNDIHNNVRERSGSLVECLTWDRGAAGSSLTGVTTLCPWARHINPS